MVDAETLFELLHVETVKQMHDIKSQDGKVRKTDRYSVEIYIIGQSWCESFSIEQNEKCLYVKSTLSLTLRKWKQILIGPASQIYCYFH